MRAVPALRWALMLKIGTLCDALPGQVGWGSAVRHTAKGQEGQESGWLIKCYVSPFRNLLKTNPCATHQKQAGMSKCQEAIPRREEKKSFTEYYGWCQMYGKTTSIFWHLWMVWRSSACVTYFLSSGSGWQQLVSAPIFCWERREDCDM